MRRLLVLLLTVCACVAADDEVEHDALDFEEVDTDGKADGPLSSFQPGRLVSDAAFFDVGAMSAPQVQDFLEHTPYKVRSFLADEVLLSGTRLSSALVTAAQLHRISPLVLLVTLQKEAGLISATKAPSRHRVDFAFGCGCPDGGTCSSAFRGLDKQLECAAGHLRRYADDLALGKTTIAGYRPGRATRVLDGGTVTPFNKATAMLYTYTPWIARGTGGNWLFWNIWRNYSNTIGYAPGLTFPFNEGFIGGSCAVDLDCHYEAGICSAGICTKACTSSCPDRGSGFATSFCAARDDGAGMCAAQCDTTLAATGCGGGTSCESAHRPGDTSVSRMVCLP